ncbi:hypothetical protein HNY73_010755 [Argiope bruennichi]|uniref:Uncharacterized protein n=1 Tax=Argiope bruennichi TaxID=94029 RepID=A0A8T0F2W8_ARGBR|nr:hypothetical protein HNY73_010755 [Argiope bruennichi]
MAKTKKECEKNKLARQKQKRECERKRRERIKSDPKLYEEAKKKERERYHARKEAGKIKSIHEMTSVREQRAKRKSWKACSRKYRAAKKNEQLVILSVDSPPSSPALPLVLNESTEPQDNFSSAQSQCASSETPINSYTSGKSRKESGRKKVKRSRSAAYRKIKKLEEELKAYKAKYSKYKSRYYREKGKKNERKDDTPSTKVKKLKFETLILLGICTHLSPVLKIVKTLVPNLKTIHFLNDGLSTQYRNRNTFYLIATHLPSVLLSAKEITWNYSEVGHGKGAPDGLGGTLKRTADALVARRKDISCFNQFVSELQKNLKSNEIIPIKEYEFSTLHENLKEEGERFIGTMKVHQVLWARAKPNVLHFRRLSCFQCIPTDICSHGYDKGVLSIQISPHQPGCSTNIIQKKSSSKKLKISDVYSDTDEEWSEDIPCKMQKTGECNAIKLVMTEDSLINTYVVAEFMGRKKTHHFVGMNLEENDCQEGGGKMYYGDFMTKIQTIPFRFHIAETYPGFTLEI